MIKLDTPIELDIRGFLRWWLAELSASVPSWLRKMVTESYDYLLVTAEGDHFQVSLVSDDPGKEFGRILLNEEGREVWYRLVSRNPNLQKAPIVLRLGAGQALVKSVMFPSAAEPNIYQVVGYEMERLTPFKVDQVYYDVRVAEKHPDLNQIRVELVLVPRKNLDAMLKRMVGLGLLPGRVDIAASEESGQKNPQLRYNLLPQKLHDKPNNRTRVINGSLLLLAMLLTGLTGALPLWMKHGYLLELEEQIRRESKIANEVQALKQEADTLLRESDFLLKKKMSEPVIVEILNELAARLPDDTWLEHLSYRNPKLLIYGQSPSASALIERLEASEIFKDTSFVSPVSQDRITGLERFQIATLVVRGKEHVPRSE